MFSFVMGILKACRTNLLGPLQIQKKVFADIPHVSKVSHPTQITKIYRWSSNGISYWILLPDKTKISHDYPAVEKSYLHLHTPLPKVYVYIYIYMEDRLTLVLHDNPHELFRTFYFLIL